MWRLLTCALVGALVSLSVTAARADCQIADAQLEEAIQQKPEFRAAENREMVRDLRTLRDAAFILWSYGRAEDCERLLANIRELVFAPSMGTLGGNDEGAAIQQDAARGPLDFRGGDVVGRRGDENALPLVSIADLAPGIRADEVIGSEVRSADDKIVGEVRNIVFGTTDDQDYVIVASGGFFTIGLDSIVVPLRSLFITQERNSLFLRITEAAMREVPLMPDQEYEWLSDRAWLARNNALFE